MLPADPPPHHGPAVLPAPEPGQRLMVELPQGAYCYTLELAEVYGGLATYTSGQHGAVLQVPAEHWVEMGRPGTRTVYLAAPYTPATPPRTS